MAAPVVGDGAGWEAISHQPQDKAYSCSGFKLPTVEFKDGRKEGK